jgi:hypothetical protein
MKKSQKMGVCVSTPHKRHRICRKFKRHRICRKFSEPKSKKSDWIQITATNPLPDVGANKVPLPDVGANKVICSNPDKSLTARATTKAATRNIGATQVQRQHTP